MIERLLRWSLSRRGAVLAAALALSALGLYRASEMPVDVFPDLTAPRVTVVTEATGLAAAELERLVTTPVEAALHGTSGLRRLRSASAPGISVVFAEFDWDTDPTSARQRVTERLSGLALPPEAAPPRLGPPSSVMGEVMFVALRSEGSPIDLRRVADLEVRRRLLGVEGVSEVVVIGGEVKQYQVLADPARLEPYHLTLRELAEALERGSRNAPGGYLVEGGQESVVRVLGRAYGVEDLERVVIATREGVAVRVRDVADVEIGAAVARGTASYGGRPAALLSVVKQPEADTRSVTRRLDAALRGLEAPLAARGVQLHRDVFRQQDFIDTAISNIGTVLRDGAILVVLVLFIFLFRVRPTLISATALPLSLLAAILALDLLGLSLDTMTLGGLAIAIGELVDDAIVDVENVTRRLGERSLLPEPERPSVIETVLSASLEVRAAIASATWIIMLVFVPLLFLEGLDGRLLRPLAIAYLVAIFASLVVAVTVTPVLCSFVLPRGAEPREPPVLRAIETIYRPALAAALRRPRAVLAAAFTLTAVGSLGLIGLRSAFLPEFNEGSVTIAMVLRPGTSLADSDALAAMAERALLADPGVLSVGRRTGRAERDEHVLGVESSELEVRIRPDDPRTRRALFADLRARLVPVPAAFTLGQPISHRIEHMISGQRTTLSIKVFGQDLKALERAAARVEAIAKTIPGLVDVAAEQTAELPELAVRVDPEAAARHGLSAGEAAEEIGAALWGATATRIHEDGTTTEVVVRYRGGHELDGLARLPIATPAGALVPLSALAELRRDRSPNYLLREDLERRTLVAANVDDPAAIDRLREALAAIEWPAGLRVELAGQFEREAEVRRRLLLLGLLSVAGIVLIVSATLASTRRALIVLSNLPFALAGGVLGVHLAGGVLSIATTIGFITLFGIAARNGILLATRVKDLEAEGVEPAIAVERAAHDRLAPILMTALTAALGLLPLALALGRPGSEIQAPMAMVILTGLASSTVLNLLVVPVLLARWGGARRAPDLTRS